MATAVFMAVVGMVIMVLGINEFLDTAGIVLVGGGVSLCIFSPLFDLL